MVNICYRYFTQCRRLVIFDDMPDVQHNYAYFPIFVDAEKYGMTRIRLYF